MPYSASMGQHLVALFGLDARARVVKARFVDADVLPAVRQHLRVLRQIPLERRVVQHRERHLETGLRVVFDGLRRFRVGRGLRLRRGLRLHFRLCRLGFRLRLRRRAGKRAGRERKGQKQDENQRTGRHFRLFCNERDALGEALFAQLHRGRAGEQLASARFRRHKAEQRPAVGRAALAVQPAQHPRVARQLAVPPGQRRGQPDEGVEPVDALADEPHKAPQLVLRAEMRQLMPQDKAERRRIGGRLGREVNFRPEQPRKARRRQPRHEPDRDGAFRAGKRLPHPPQLPEKSQILCQHHARQYRRPGEPSSFQNRPDRQPVLRLRLCLYLCRRGLRGGRFGRGLRGAAVFRGGQPLHGGRHVRRGVHHADRAADQRDRKQQPQRSEQPQRILQPRIDPAAQQQPQRGQRKDENGG